MPNQYSCDGSGITWVHVDGTTYFDRVAKTAKKDWAKQRCIQGRAFTNLNEKTGGCGTAGHGSTTVQTTATG